MILCGYTTAVKGERARVGVGSPPPQAESRKRAEKVLRRHNYIVLIDDNVSLD